MFIQVILPLKIDFEPYYQTDRKVSEGDRLLVRMSGKEYTAVVSKTEAVPDIPENKIQQAIMPANPLPAITQEELAFWRFLSRYYICSIGEIYAAAYPDLKTAGEANLAAARKRREQKARKDAGRKAEIIKRLEERLAKKDAELDKNHGPAVEARLKEERKKILQEISARQSEQEDTGNSQDSCTDRPLAHTRDKDARHLLQLPDQAKPILLQGGRQRDSVIAECIKDTLAGGYNCLIIVPEIKISENLIKLLGKKTGGRITVFNSSESMGKRREAADELRNGNASRVYVGTRSSLFLPFRRLGLIVVDSEESPSHKSESTPRFNARDAAVMLSRIHQCRLILSSPCPSLESVNNVRTGKYGFMELPAAAGETEIIDTAEEAKKRGMAGLFSLRLINEIRKTIQKGNKVLVLHPRTDEDPRQHLSVYARDLSADENVEIGNLYENKFRDISGFCLVSIIQTDRLGRQMDFRTDERALQAIMKVRTGFDGKLIIQAQGTGKNFLKLNGQTVNLLLKERKDYSLPPFTRLIDIRITDHSENRLEYLTKKLYETLTLSGYHPEIPAQKYVGKDPQEGFRYIRITIPKDSTGPAARDSLHETIRTFERKMKYTGHITLDVDPV